jgi:DNA mismatch repair ATPase MutS
LCILDELGRGTATFDGTAIAHAVVEHLVSSRRCRTLFATHYHSLVHDWEVDPRVRLGHMDCLVQGAAEDSAAAAASTKSGGATEEVTFLYKLSEGCSPRSYGINVARLAGLPAQVIELALKQSRAFEERMQSVHAARQHSSGAAQGDGGSGVARLGQDQVVRVFERLVSLARSTGTVPELAFVARELWRRLTAMVNAVN